MPDSSNHIKTLKPYGSWPSTITADLLSDNNVSLSEPRKDGSNLYWLENRPHEKGRSAIVQLKADGSKCDILPQTLNVRSRVNEYGGGSYCVANNTIYFVLADDQRVYRIDLDSQSPYPHALTPVSKCRYGDLTYDEQRERVIAVCEEHHESPNENENTDNRETQEPSSYLVSIDASNKSDELCAPLILCKGADFYASPRLSPNGKQLSWISWNHPNMPWDGSECWTANINSESKLGETTLVAGGTKESIFQPTWSPDGTLYFLSDKNNWTNLYRSQNNIVTCVLDKNLEFATPQWVFGLSTFGFISAHKIICTYSHLGIWHLGTIELGENGDVDFQTIDTDFNDISYVQANDLGGVFVAASATKFPALYQIDTENKISTIHKSSELEIDAKELSIAERIQFPLTAAVNNLNEDVGKVGYAFYYPPINQHYSATENELPPCIVLCHGGPTTATRSALNLKIQYWTNRGFAIVDINYGGSTGYGRDYRERLIGQWGIVDVEDAVACVNYLVQENKIDRNKVAIKGGSAGGYTVLAALTFHDVFKAGASYYGIGNLETLAMDTHKFESRYMDSLVGPYPKDKTTYFERSPINFVEKLNCPIIFLQGLQDKVVPPNQAETMVAALDEKKIPHAYIQFETEGHGFRRAENIKRSIEAEYYFYSQVFGYDVDGSIEKIPIAHSEVLKAQ